MKDAWRDSAVVAALVRSATVDRPSAGAKGRALGRLGIEGASALPSRALHGALVAAAIALSLGWSPATPPRDAGAAATTSSGECSSDHGVRVETRPGPCDAETTGGSSGDGSWRGSSG